MTGLHVAALVAALAPSSPSVSADTTTLYVHEGGKKVAVLHACKNERFYPGTNDSGTAPTLSPDGKWMLLLRVFPFEQHGRIDQSSLLLDMSNGRAYAWPFFARRFGAGTPIVETWVAGKPATIRVVGSRGTKEIALPGPLKDIDAPDRCAL